MLGAVQGLELGKGVEIGHWSPSGFVSFGQFSLNKPGARPVFVAFGRGAEVALRGMKSAAESYRPEAFDEDGYLRHAPGVGQATE
jgi:hypothetical protein